MQLGSFGFQQQVCQKEKPPADILGEWHRLIYRRKLWASTTIVMSASGKERKPKEHRSYLAWHRKS
jgi:hypothetical protein